MVQPNNKGTHGVRDDVTGPQSRGRTLYRDRSEPWFRHHEARKSATGEERLGARSGQVARTRASD